MHCIDFVVADSAGHWRERWAAELKGQCEGSFEAVGEKLVAS